MVDEPRDENGKPQFEIAQKPEPIRNISFCPLVSPSLAAPMRGGIAGPNGEQQVAFMPKIVPIPCQGEACALWGGKRCGLIR